MIGLNQYRYDAENRLCPVYNGVVGGYAHYFYDAEGTRVAKATASSLVCPGTSAPSASSITEKYLVGSAGEEITVLDGSNKWLHSNVYAAGALLASYDATGVHFPIADPLGTVRVQFSATAPGREKLTRLARAYHSETHLAVLVPISRTYTSPAKKETQNQA